MALYGLSGLVLEINLIGYSWATAMAQFTCFVFGARQG